MGASSSSSGGERSTFSTPKSLKLPRAALKLIEKKPYFFLGEIDLDPEELEKDLVYIKPKTEDNIGLEKRTKIKHANLLKSRLIDRSSRDSFPFFRLKDTTLLSFEGPPEGGCLHELLKEQEIERRKFTEEEILKTLTELVSCLSLFERKGLIHGDLNSETIFYDSQSNLFKIYDHALMSGSTIMGFWRGFKHHQRVYLSPELLKALEHKDCDIGKEKALKSDIFALGMVLLETATLKDSSECFDLYNYRILRELLDSRLEEVKEQYGNILFYLIKEMLSENWEERPSAARLLSRLDLLLCVKPQDYGATVPSHLLDTCANDNSTTESSRVNYVAHMPVAAQRCKVPDIASEAGCENVHYRHFSSYVPPCSNYLASPNHRFRKYKVDYKNNLLYELPFGTISAMPRITYVGGRVSIRNDLAPLPSGYRIKTDGSENMPHDLLQQRKVYSRGQPLVSARRLGNLSLEKDGDGLKRSIVLEKATRISKPREY